MITLGGIADAALISALQHGIDIRAAAHQENARWLPTHVALDSLFLGEERRRPCNEIALDIEVGCWARMDTVVVRTAGGNSRIDTVLVRSANEVDADNAPSPDPNCEAYLRCLAAARIGSVIPLPREAQRVVALTQYTQYVWPPSGKLFDAEAAETMAATIEAMIASLRARAETDTEARVRLAEFEDVAAYLRHHSHALGHSG